ncbi:transcriptional regulator SplA domain-containing protein [Gracilibacillus saliphilus]|uniref:transcriptional regulator SplA domain-containing protein n=1 Tax=Gracilibacillus saliphilus TaxID=543890 RepID=UPI0013D709E0|nr:transcriptional regulator SplA domain-containing protein [Gracilibacillus saliphilus]
MEMHDSEYQAGDIVYVFYRNPHTQDVAHMQEAAVVRNPEDPNEGLALFLYETYYPLDSEMAIYKSEEEAEKAYQEYFGDDSGGQILW